MHINVCSSLRIKKQVKHRLEIFFQILFGYNHTIFKNTIQLPITSNCSNSFFFFSQILYPKHSNWLKVWVFKFRIKQKMKKFWCVKYLVSAWCLELFQKWNGTCIGSFWRTEFMLSSNDNTYHNEELIYFSHCTLM